MKKNAGGQAWEACRRRGKRFGALVDRKDRCAAENRAAGFKQTKQTTDRRLRRRGRLTSARMRAILCVVRYNFFTWFLSVSVKPKLYRVWKYCLMTVMFLAWVIFLAVYRDYYWQFSLYACVPLFIVDFGWDMFNFARYRRKVVNGEIDEWADLRARTVWDGIVFGCEDCEPPKAEENEEIKIAPQADKSEQTLYRNKKKGR